MNARTSRDLRPTAHDDARRSSADAHATRRALAFALTVQLIIPLPGVQCGLEHSRAASAGSTPTLNDRPPSAATKPGGDRSTEVERASSARRLPYASASQPAKRPRPEEQRVRQSAARSRDGIAAAADAPLSAEQVASVLRAQRQYLQLCYERSARRWAWTGSTRIELEIEIANSGEVTRARASGSPAEELNQCIARSAQRWRFPIANSVTRLRLPLVFQPGT